ncbi:MAG: hypothetical protein OHK0017_06340 [Patescibacteria group bacterium]
MTQGKNQPFLSACMIVRNEESILEKSLQSIIGVVDEIIIIDTGSTDSTVEIAKKYADKVGFFKWVDDFSAARNYSVEQTNAEYVIAWDADFILDQDSRQKLIELKSRRFNGSNLVFINWITEFDSKTLKPLKSVQRDLIYRRRDFIWKSPIHNRLVPRIFTQVKPLKCPEINIYHWKDPQEKSHRYQQTMQILEKTMKNPRLGKAEKKRLGLFYAQSLIFERRFNEAVNVLQDLIQISSKSDTEGLVFILEKLAICLFSLGDTEGAYKIVSKYQSQLVSNKRFILLLADVNVFVHPQKALELYNLYLEAPLKSTETAWDYDVFRFGPDYSKKMIGQVQELLQIKS